VTNSRLGWIWIIAGAMLPLVLSAPARSALPELRETDNSVPRSLRTGEKYLFRIQYSDPDGDRPISPTLVTEGPEGVHRWPAEALGSSTANYKRPTMLEFMAGPFSSGDHTAHFEVVSVVGKARYPGNGGGLSFTVEDVLLKWIELLIGLAVALLLLPLMTFVLVRSANPRSDPSRAVRFGLLVGIVASYALFVYLFSALYPLPWMIVLGVLALGLLFALVPRRV
jgi:hypothetical protein